MTLFVQDLVCNESLRRETLCAHGCSLSIHAANWSGTQVNRDTDLGRYYNVQSNVGVLKVSLIEVCHVRALFLSDISPQTALVVSGKTDA